MKLYHIDYIRSIYKVHLDYICKRSKQNIKKYNNKK